MTENNVSRIFVQRHAAWSAARFAVLVLASLVTAATASQPNSSHSAETQATRSRFLPAVTYSSAGTITNAVPVADLNGDQKPDIVVANGYNADGNGGVGVLLGNGDGSFKPAVTYDSGGRGANANSIVIADLNADGRPDIVVTDSCNDSFCGSGNWVAVLLGNGDGTFQKAQKYRTGGASWAVAVGDVNGDGKPDLIVANVCSGSDNIHTCKKASNIAVLLGLGNGQFAAAQTYPVNGYGTYFLALGDFNGDGKLDVVATSFCSDPPDCTNGGVVGMLLGNGDGTFQPVVDYLTGGAANGVAVGDLNGDGKLDIAVANGGSKTVSVFLGNGDGTLKPPSIYSVPGLAAEIAIGDVNQDGKPDLVVTTGDYTVVGGASVLLGKGNGKFKPPTTYSALEYGVNSIKIADLNGDGKPDLVVSSECDSSGCESSAAGVVSVLLQSSAR
jgi:hypothetical protein